MRTARVPPPSVVACLSALGSDAGWRGEVARRDNSRVHRAHRGDLEIAIKECFIPRTDLADRALAEREFAALRRICEGARSASVAPPTPAPLALCAEHGAYAMTWIDGRPATDVLLSTQSPADAERIGYAAGAWLKGFHALQRLPPRPPDYRGKIAFVRALGASHASSRPVRRATRVLIETVDAACAATLPASWIHGDMKSDNLLIHGSAMAGIDAHIVDENVVLYDLAPFLDHLGLLRWSPRGMTRGRVLKKAGCAFLDAYSNEACAWALPLAWLRAYLLVQAYAATHSRRGMHERLREGPLRLELASVVQSLASAAHRS
jgi:aminoglycoside phosphotransferase (APT) family kinase protein